MTDHSAPIETGRWFALSGPSEPKETRTLPVRGDLAHVALAGRVFVPHYAAPMPLNALETCSILAEPRAGAEPVGTLEKGMTFDVLDIAGDWAWGLIGHTGPVGYVAMGSLEKQP